MKVCVIIPTYNNSTTIERVVNDVLAQCQDVIVVNDGSTDETLQVLKQLGNHIIQVKLSSNQGKGCALLAGFKKAKELGFTHAITIDADGQHFASDIPAFLEAAKKCERTIVVGSRNLTEKNMPRQNTFANRFSNFWFRLQTGISLPDTQSGFRLYPLEELKGLSLITSRYEAELELLVFAAWNGVNITTIPIHVYYPPEEERVSHFRPIYDFVRISILNTLLCIGTIVYALPLRCWRIIFSNTHA